MEVFKEYNVWLQKAKDDLKWTEHDLEGKIYYGACFAAQQAAEKALKGFLIFRNQEIRKIHDLLALLEECINLDNSFEEIKQAAKILSRYYITTRYPVYEEFAIFSEEQAKEAYEFAQEIVEFVEKKLVG
ncbi:MAG: HEPN domain-containing protein [Microgenomates group bacterium Gr01-1014_80]|nr:MAG: HEPN domain-containing protein [Microgenomates group bacterium Gr01-1014_80]